jgi:hypothetical protein
VKHPMQGLTIPNHVSPRFLCTRFIIWHVVVDGMDIHTTTTIIIKKLSCSVWRNQESDWGTTWLCYHMSRVSPISLIEISLIHSSDLVEAECFMRWQFIYSPLSPHPWTRFYIYIPPLVFYILDMNSFFFHLGFSGSLLSYTISKVLPLSY